MATYQDSYRMVNGQRVPYTIQRKSDGSEVYSSDGAPGINGYTFYMSPDSVYTDFHYMGASLPPEEREIKGDALNEIKQRQAVLNKNAGEKQSWLQYYMPNTYKGLRKAKSMLGFENGGELNYARYLQMGGTAQQQGGIEEQVASLVQAAMQGDEQAKGQIEQIMQAAQQGDKQAAQIAQLIQAMIQQMQGKTEEMQGGGAVIGAIGNAAASVMNSVAANARQEEAARKARYDNGGEPITPIQKEGGKTPCPCTYKKEGGKLVMVDCNGNVIKRK